MHALSGARHLVNKYIDCALLNAVLTFMFEIEGTTNATNKNIAIMLQRRQCLEELPSVLLTKRYDME